MCSSHTRKDGRVFGWYAKRLAVVFSFGYLILFEVLLLIRLIPTLSAVSGWALLAAAPAIIAANAFLQFASKGYNCNSGPFDDQLLAVLTWALASFVAWFQYFVIGFLSGVSIDAVAAFKRRLQGQRSPG